MDNDIELLRAWRGGDTSAGEALIQNHFDGVCRFFRSKLPVEAEDLIQRTFLDLSTSTTEIQSGHFRAFLFTIARNRLYDHLRSVGRTPAMVDIGELSIARHSSSPSQKLGRSQEEQLLVDALRRIPLDQQIAIELAYWEEMSGPEIADVLDIPPNTVRSRLARGRQALREEILAMADTPALATSTLQSVEHILQKYP